uniref:Uncharacterized protein n=1 Tax=Rhodnius prolixus TaxID=13249 RepID=T1I710_RHOPR
MAPRILCIFCVPYWHAHGSYSYFRNGTDCIMEHLVRLVREGAYTQMQRSGNNFDPELYVGSFVNRYGHRNL